MPSVIWVPHAPYNTAIRYSLVVENPMRAIKLFREQHRVRFLAEDEERRLREAMDPAAWVPVEFALHTGVRQGEQFGLRSTDVDMANSVVTIPLTKSGRTRHVFLKRTALTILQAQPSRLKSSIVDFRWHDLRHTFASRLTMAGGDLRTVQELMRTRRSP
jgi:site-specific recombinase XerD